MIDVICGPMASGKSLELIRKITRYRIADKNIVIFKPQIDSRDGNTISSREGSTLKDIFLVKNSYEIKECIENICMSNVNFNPIDVIAIDEAQFFDKDIVALIHTLNVIHNKEIIISGLEKDAYGHPFGPMPDLLAIADNITKLSAVCMKCKIYPANFTYKKDNNNQQIEIGGDELYEARCKKCWLEGKKYGL